MEQGNESIGTITARTWRIYVHVWLVCLIFPIVALIQAHATMPDRIIASIGLVSYVAFYTWYMRPHPINSAEEMGLPYSQPLLAIGLVTLLSLLLSAAYSISFLWLLVGTSAVAGKTLPMRWAYLLTTVLPLLALAAGIVLSGGFANVEWLHIIPLALFVRVFGLDMIGLSLLSGTIHELHTARAELAQRAVTEERLRLARDLHDLLGHTLSLIVLKSELAGRLLEKKSAQAAQEIHELETVARQTLREVRQAVAGYRQPTLDGELDAARQILEAADIHCEIHRTQAALASEIDAVLAWTIREGVTNVIHHSRAHFCKIHIMTDNDCVRTTITNDDCTAPLPTTIHHGNGLSGLMERIRSQGGSIQAVPYKIQGCNGFRLEVELPIPEHPHDERKG